MGTLARNRLMESRSSGHTLLWGLVCPNVNFFYSRISHPVNFLVGRMDLRRDLYPINITVVRRCTSTWHGKKISGKHISLTDGTSITSIFLIKVYLEAFKILLLLLINN